MFAARSTPLEEMFAGWASGWLVAVVVIALLLTAYFQSVRLALVGRGRRAGRARRGRRRPAAVTGTTLNLQSFMGAIMAVGVATANAILLVTFAERARLRRADRPRRRRSRGRGPGSGRS